MNNRKSGHRKTVRLMRQPAEGWYADCSCGGYTGALFHTRDQADDSFQAHRADPNKSATEIAKTIWDKEQQR